MLGWRCELCGIGFDADEARCPKCLRKSTVRAASEVRAGARGRPVARIALALGLGALMLLPGGLVLPLEGRYLVDGVEVRASVTSRREASGRAAPCDVRYRFELDGASIAGADRTYFGCPRGGLTVEALRSDPSTSRARGVGVWLSRLGLAVMSALGLMLLLTGAHLLAPDVIWLRDVMAWLGSKDARAAKAAAGDRAPRTF